MTSGAFGTVVGFWVRSFESENSSKIPLNHEEINQLFFTSFMKSATISVEEK